MSQSTYDFDDAAGPYSPVQQDGGVSNNNLVIVGSGATFGGTYLDLPAGVSLSAGPFGIQLPTDTDPTATSRRNGKKAEQQALGVNGAGTTWFRYLQTAHNPALS